MLFGKTIEDVMNELDGPMEVKDPAQQISDVLCTRDSFFHSCWTRLKYLKPDLIREMGDIELFIAGYDTSTEEEQEEDTEEDTHGTIL